MMTPLIVLWPLRLGRHTLLPVSGKSLWLKDLVEAEIWPRFPGDYYVEVVFFFLTILKWGFLQIFLTLSVESEFLIE